MIMPDMATMLAFITTNASVEPELLSAALRAHTEETFNRISIDGEMSTNDTVLLLASGDAGPHMSDSRGTQFKRFEDMLHAVMQDLAQQIVQDGEGATKLLTFRVRGAASPGDAEKAARSVSNSLLVKTAFFGEDYNWGRIMGALGASGARLHMDRVDISFNGTPAVRNGTEAAANRARLKKAVRSKAIEIEIDLNAGAHSCEIAACDLSYEYVKINAEYTS